MSEVKLILGDCLSVMKSMPDKSVNCVLTDPPYDFSISEQIEFMEEMTRISKGAIIIFCPPENQWIGKPDQYLFWIKPISTKNTSKSYSRFVEMIYVWNGKIWNSDGHWSQYTNVFTDLVDGKLHPYQKPLSMMTRLINNHTNVGDTILDPFLGSGTTGIACVQTGRNFIGCDIDEGYFKIAEKRIHDVQQQIRIEFPNEG